MKDFLHPWIIRWGYQLPAPAAEEDKLEHLFKLLLAMDFVPGHIVDVGANHGNWTRTALKYFPSSMYTLLEPQQWLEKHMADMLAKKPKVKLYPFGAGSSKGTFKFTLLDRDDSSNFMLSEEEARKMGLRQIDVDVVTLNEFLPETGGPVPDLIKIDAEGLDLEVLAGASDYFGRTEMFIVEAGVGSKYIKNDIASVISFMSRNGYRLFDLTDLNRPFSPPVLWLAELVFIREQGILHSRTQKLGDDLV